MFWFKKKKEKSKTVEMPQVCNHKYRDFNWYIDATYYNDTGSPVSIKDCFINMGAGTSGSFGGYWAATTSY